MDPTIINIARTHVANLFGEALATKATDALCLAIGTTDTASEELRPPLSTGIILEFILEPKVSDAVDDAVEQVRKSKAWSSIRRALKKAEIDPVTKGVVREVMESGRSEPELLPIQTARLLRYLKVMTLRDNFLKAAGPITDAVERGFRSLPSTERFVRSPSVRDMTQVCWLNRTVWSWPDPRALAEVVQDDSIVKVDLPRRLASEVNVSANTITAPQFRKKHKLTGKGIVVAVIDGEVALTHPALKGRVVHTKNYTQELWGNPDWHGTSVAGIVASNDTSFPGIAPDATVYNYKVLATNRTLTNTDFDGSLAIQQALEDGAHIANCSWGNGPAGDGSSREARACNQAWKAGLVIVKSAGNNGPGPRTLTTPADADGVIVVGATEREGTVVQDYSSRGPAGTKLRPHLVVPGGIRDDIGITSCLVGGGFGDTGAGTSFSAPHVAGVLALMLQRDSSATPDELREMLLRGCSPLSGFDQNTQGRGLLSMARIT